MEKLIVSSSPHIQSKTTTQGIMRDVLIALLPATVAGVILFGWRALVTILVCVASAVISEFLFNLICKKEQTVTDLSAVVTGLLLALSLPAQAGIWHCVIGSVFAIVVVKCLFGGIGQNSRGVHTVFFKRFKDKFSFIIVADFADGINRNFGTDFFNLCK